MSVRELRRSAKAFLIVCTAYLTMTAEIGAQWTCKDCVQGQTPGCGACSAAWMGAWQHCDPVCGSGGGCWVGSACNFTLHDAIVSPVGRIVAVALAAPETTGGAIRTEASNVVSRDGELEVTNEWRNCTGLLISRAYSNDATTKIRSFTKVIRI